MFATGQRKKLVFTATDIMLFDSNNLVYFEVLRPKNISYVYKVRPAKSFGGKFVSELSSQIQINFKRYLGRVEKVYKLICVCYEMMNTSD